jgi:hypothetical protein
VQLDFAWILSQLNELNVFIFFTTVGTVGTIELPIVLCWDYVVTKPDRGSGKVRKLVTGL